MDRASELRLLMKSTKTTASSNNNNSKINISNPLSGIEKAKLLKQQLKEKHKNDTVSVQQKHQQESNSNKNTKNIIATNTTNTNIIVQSNLNSDKLPKDFFDISQALPIKASSLINNNNNNNTILELKHPKQQNINSIISLKDNSTTNKQQQGVVTQVLPMGFFDNPIEDLNAHGITMEQYKQTIEKEEEHEFKQFMNEIKEIEPSLEDIEKNYNVELVLHDLEDDAIQMSYLASIIELRNQQSHLFMKKNDITTTTTSNNDSTLDMLENIKKEAFIFNSINNDINVTNNQDILNKNMNNEVVQDILYAKLQLQNNIKKKRKYISLQHNNNNIEQIQDQLIAIKNNSNTTTNNNINKNTTTTNTTNSNEFDNDSCDNNSDVYDSLAYLNWNN